MCSAGTTLVPAALGGVAWSSRRTAATPGLLVIARADDVDGVVVTGIKRQGRLVDTQDDMPLCEQSVSVAEQITDADLWRVALKRCHGAPDRLQ
jgi:hypothetical protein